jgi:Na+/H+ antiporter NhaD/arsenite permease-like protein
MPDHAREVQAVIPFAVFAATYFVVALGHVPGFRIDRTGAAIIGASLMIGTGTLTFEEAVQAVDYSTLVLLFGMIAFFFAGWPVARVAIVAGALLLITRRVKPEKVYHEIDWALLALFAGLFVVVAGVEKTSLDENLFRFASHFRLGNVWVLSGFSALVSNLVSNVPAVLVFRPLMDHLPYPQQGWLTLAMSSTLAGNLTILGSVANLIVVQRARREVTITFWQYLRAGVPLTLLTLAVGAAWFQWHR